MKDMLATIRAGGWRVAVHNDYRLNGEDWTFWLFTSATTGRFVKGEGRTDEEALEQVYRKTFESQKISEATK